MGVHAAHRLSGFDYTGPHTYSVTCCTFSRRRWFTDSSTVEAVRLALLQSCQAEGFIVLAYCFMPDHVHLLVEGTSAASDLRRTVVSWKQKTGYEHRSKTGSALWQGGFYDHILREEEDRPEVVKYPIENPIRAGLVSAVNEYPFWGSGICSRAELIETLFDQPDIHPEGNR